ncbi:MAG: cytochrome c peroxidase [Pseudomonadota bacterium]
MSPAAWRRCRPRTGSGIAIFVALMVAAPLAAALGGEAWETESEQLKLAARLEPQLGRVRIGEFQRWVLSLEAADGTPVERARMLIDGGMPSHGHGLPTQPRVTEYLGGGRYLIEGVRFNMLGEWVLAFALELPDGRDYVAFRLDLDALSPDEVSRITALRLESSEPPGSVSNRYADDARAAALGERLFFDASFSPDGTLSCASCHEPDHYFTDGKPRAEGVHRTGRHTPTVVGSGFQTWFYWDGRRDSLWSQALVPFEAPDEMGGSRTRVVRAIADDEVYRRQYEQVFGALPESVAAGRFPEQAGPLGDSGMRDAWFRIPEPVRRDINRVYVNLGKALEAFQRTLSIPRARFDDYADALAAGDPKADRLLSRDERAGLRLFVDVEKTHCLRCHNGPRLTNDGFSNIGTGSFEGDNLDFGRVFGLRAVMTDEFNCAGPYSDADPDDCLHLKFLNRNAHVPLEGAFKVPSLRNVANTAPYMHDGRFADLDAVIEHYRNPPDSAGDHELVALELSDREARQLAAFLETLSAEP